jgi:hypothetical protein
MRPRFQQPQVPPLSSGTGSHGSAAAHALNVADSVGAAGRPRRPGYASRRLSTQNVTPSRTAASTTKMPVSMPWKAQNLLAGW